MYLLILQTRHNGGRYRRGAVVELGVGRKGTGRRAKGREQGRGKGLHTLVSPIKVPKKPKPMNTALIQEGDQEIWGLEVL
jgi:hypothetical protein